MDLKISLKTLQTRGKVAFEDCFTKIAKAIAEGREPKTVKDAKNKDLKVIELVNAWMFYSKRIYSSEKTVRNIYKNIIFKHGKKLFLTEYDIKVLFLELIKLANIQAKKRMLELRVAIGVFLLFILASLQKTTLLQTSTQAYQPPPTKLFTKALTHYKHSIARP